MVPLGPLKTAHSEVMDHYKTIVDRYDGSVYPNMIVVALEGVTPYNSYINHTPPYEWIIHPNWYTTAGYRAKNGGVLGRSDGCITLDPVENNQLVTRLQAGVGLRDCRRCANRTVLVTDIPVHLAPEVGGAALRDTTLPTARARRDIQAVAVIGTSGLPVSDGRRARHAPPRTRRIPLIGEHGRALVGQCHSKKHPLATTFLRYRSMAHS